MGDTQWRTLAIKLALAHEWIANPAETSRFLMLIAFLAVYVFLFIMAAACILFHDCSDASKCHERCHLDCTTQCTRECKEEDEKFSTLMRTIYFVAVVILIGIVVGFIYYLFTPMSSSDIVEVLKKATNLTGATATDKPQPAPAK